MPSAEWCHGFSLFKESSGLAFSKAYNTNCSVTNQRTEVWILYSAHCLTQLLFCTWALFMGTLSDRTASVPSCLLCSLAQPWFGHVIYNIHIKSLWFGVTGQTRAKEPEVLVASQAAGQALPAATREAQQCANLSGPADRKACPKSDSIKLLIIVFPGQQTQGFWVCSYRDALSPFRGNTASEQALQSLLRKDFSGTREIVLPDWPPTPALLLSLVSLTQHKP